MTKALVIKGSSPDRLQVARGIASSFGRYSVLTHDEFVSKSKLLSAMHPGHPRTIIVTDFEFNAFTGGWVEELLSHEVWSLQDEGGFVSAVESCRLIILSLGQTPPPNKFLNFMRVDHGSLVQA